VYVVGDSMAQTLSNGLNDQLARRDHLYFIDAAEPQCSLVPTLMHSKDFNFQPKGRCTWRRGGLAAKWANAERFDLPAVSMLLFRLDVVDHLLDGRWTRIGEPGYDCELRHRLVEAASVLASDGRPVLLLTSPYYSTGEQPDGSSYPEDAHWRVRAYNAMLRSVAAQFPGVVHVYDLNQLVDPGGQFTLSIGGVSVRWVDGVHFTYSGGRFVLPHLVPVLRQLAAEHPTAAALAALQAAGSAPDACQAG
jgi:hypothetical protein